MLFGILIILLALQFVLFLTGVVCNKRISDTNRILGNVFRFLYIFDSYVMIGFIIVFAAYVFSQKSTFFVEGGKSIYYILIVGLIIGNFSKVIIEYFESLENAKENSVRDIICIIGYVISIFIIAASIYTICLNEVTYVPAENRKVVEEYEYTDIEIGETTTNTNKENFSIIMINKNNIENVLLINTKHISSTNAQSKYIEKYEVKEITENCFGNKKENIYYEYIIYTPDKTERNLISLYGNFAKNN